MLKYTLTLYGKLAAVLGLAKHIGGSADIDTFIILLQVLNPERIPEVTNLKETHLRWARWGDQLTLWPFTSQVCMDKVCLVIRIS